MDGIYNSLPITGVARAITDIAGISAPTEAGPALDIARSRAKIKFEDNKTDRVFIYNPDAVALWLFQKYTTLFEDAVVSSDIQLPMLSVMPSVTPVCFASMYTGALPDVHGIKSYTKPVVKTDSVFDAFIRAGVKPVIVSTGDNSMSRIFLERDMDYFIYDSTAECNKKALELIEEDRYALIALYNGNYDAAMHRNGPESDEALSELSANIETYAALIKHIEIHWRSHRTLAGFCPDHGCHAIDGGIGSHGLDMPEDMNVVHFYRFI